MSVQVITRLLTRRCARKSPSLPAPLKTAAKDSPAVCAAQKLFSTQIAETIDNRELWLKIGRALDLLKLKDRGLAEHLKTFLSHRVADPGKHVLEVGCASGINARYLKQLQPEQKYTGIDIMEASIAEARRIVRTFSFEVRDILNPYTAIKYDAAFSANLLSFLSPEQQMTALRNLRDQLQPRAPVLLRWFAGMKTDFITNEQEIGDNDKVKWWEMYATPEYIKEVLSITGFSFGNADLRTQSLSIYSATPFQRFQNYHTVYARRD